MPDLKALIEAVEAGTAKGEDFNVAPSAGWFGHSEMDAYRAYHGDMNAALSLLKELLPGWKVENLSQAYDLKWWCCVHRPVEGDDKGNITRHGVTCSAFDFADPARALLLATLKAVEAQK